MQVLRGFRVFSEFSEVSVSSFLGEFENKTYVSKDLTSKVHVNCYSCIYFFFTVLDVLESGATI